MWKNSAQQLVRSYNTKTATFGTQYNNTNPAGSCSPSTAINSTGQIISASLCSATVGMAIYDNGGQSMTNLSNIATGGCSVGTNIDIDSSGNVHLLYATACTSQALQYYNSTNMFTTIGASYNYTLGGANDIGNAKMIVGKNDAVHFAYRNTTSRRIFYTKKNSTASTLEIPRVIGFEQGSVGFNFYADVNGVIYIIGGNESGLWQINSQLMDHHGEHQLC